MSFGRIFSLISFVTATASAQSSSVVFSGGGSPAGNHYSQYLQTGVMAEHARRVDPQTDVFFGSGQKSGANPDLADVHRMVHEADGRTREFMIPGQLPGNRAAYKKDFLALLQAKLPRVTSPSSSFFLFVSDHGMPNMNADGSYDTTFQNNCIDTWSVVKNGDELRDLPWAERCLSRVDLQQAILANSRAKSNVFVMSQCFSGGFHRMSVDVRANEVRANPRICGFTAITEDTTASGCTPDVDGPGYQGYERFMTQQISGRDVVTGRVLRPPRASIREAHEAASLEDLTVDIPLSTSDFYLEKWSQILARSNTAEFRRAFADASPGVDPDFERRRLYVERTVAVVGRVLPKQMNVLRANNPEAFQQALAGLQNRQAQFERRFQTLNKETSAPSALVLSAWEKEVVLSRAPILNDQERRFEVTLLAWEKQGALDQALIMSLATMTVKNPAMAEQLSQFASQRRLRRLEWASQQNVAALRQAADTLKRIETLSNQLSDSYFMTQKSFGLIRRVLVYRSALAAWKVLDQQRRSQALTDLRGLLACESAEFR